MRSTGRLFAAVLLLAAPARAQRGEARGLQLEWRAPSGCPSSADVERRVLDLLGGEAPQLRVEAIVTHDERGHRLVLDLGALGQRHLEASSCEALAEAASVVLALVAARQEESAAAPPPPPRPAARHAPAPPGRTSVRPPPEPWRLGIRVPVVLYELGSLPEPNAGLGLGLEVAARRLQLAVAGAYWLPQTSVFDERPELGARFQRLSLDASLGYALLAAGAWQAGAGAVLSVDRVEADGLGPDDFEARSPRAWLASFGPAGFVRAKLDARWFTFAQGAALLSPSRPAFTFDAVGTLHRPSLFSGRAWLGVGLEL